MTNTEGEQNVKQDFVSMTPEQDNGILRETPGFPGRQKRAREKFYSLLQHYIGSNPNSRPLIPVMKNITNSKPLVSLINSTLTKYFKTPRNLQEINVAIYKAAVTIIEFNGQKTYQLGEWHGQKKDTVPAWRKRLESDINRFRSNADVIHAYLQNIRPKKITTKATKLAGDTGINMHDNGKLLEVKDLFKQKAKIKGASCTI